jgi:predicted SAM-dependent methyltransferase
MIATRMDQPVKLNLGAGLMSRPGWVNYDRSRVVYIARNAHLRRIARVAGRIGLVSKDDVLDWPENTRSVDLTKAIPEPDDAAEAIFSSHMLEHVRPEQAEFILRECFRVLRPGGVIRIAVPDLRRAAERYLDGDAEFFRGADGRPMADLFVESLHLRTRPKGNAIERLLRRVLRTDEGGHRWMYDGDSMSRRLGDAGFRDIRIRRFRDSSHPEMGLLDARERDSVFVEAIK